MSETRIDLGVFDGHNAAACLSIDGRVVAALQEERLTRLKNDVGTPVRAIEWLATEYELDLSQITQVAVASRYVARMERPEDLLKGFDRRYEGTPHYRLATWLGRQDRYRNWRTGSRIQQRTETLTRLGLPRDRIQYYDHHETHAATAYHGLRQDDGDYLVITLDGGGDGLSGSVWKGAGGQLHPLAQVSQRDSLGELYAVVTHLLGFKPLEHEFKIMGMAPYATDEYAEPVAAILRRYLRVERQGLRWICGVREPIAQVGRRLEKDLRRVRFDSICAGLQKFTEEAMTQWVSAWIQETGLRRVLVAGGVFMNVKASKVICELPEVDFFAAFPSCGDESLPFGACYLATAGRGVMPDALTHAYLGPEVGLEESRAVVADAGERVHVEEPGDMADRVAELLADGQIVARASGKMEFGARALGSRSILADPINQDVVRVINRMIKKRDFWMPFAPVVRRQEAAAYFRNPKDLPSPYMMNTFDSTDRRTEFMAAVHNADLTARPQLLEDGQNPGYEAILDRFAQRTGRHVLLNTSFNLHGEPVVSGAADAVRVLLNSGLRYLALGDLLVTKRGAP
ncbi:MAG TPA: carbamoyltransferase C-terminal domain-containing protein [Candidatus Latescibacteria bacterium]|jgi:carbamoyltransferase|nr:hypothetical protein [Gemmatimonadota bacterium]MDP7363133.1 carbamoyltransferase C-terminal domain-containing protein [Candidatus Latescibacterota bacterium]MDP7632311.1 carbamoyltransferase C-terminal domain-containing protein [Candidatus Latescibacterota bacterium]HCV24894.1 hypothetical protein [Candidatus Latescibacterota bacterium]HJN26321.1 carbamoyltransferase C-terminal domain-containing protein [Candidatus Latescibacterota bacterium]|tara:strand:- start:1884 stop:3599 length:1716 start_codon:yes stop_codon:yes gene_type:complete